MARKKKEKTDRDYEQDALFKEVDEDLREEQFMRLSKKYGPYVVGATVGILAAVGGYQFWQARTIEQQGALGEKFNQAQRLAQDANTDQAIKTFSELAKEADGGYATLSRFREAGLLAIQGNTEKQDPYLDVAKKTEDDPLYRDLAILIDSIKKIDAGNAKDAEPRLKSLSQDGNPWRYSARELLALAALQQGDKKAALDRYSKLLADRDTPTNMRRRAVEMVSFLSTE